MDITGKKLFVKALLEEGVDTVFAYPGGTVTDLFDELYLNGKIDLVLPRHEQALVHEAEGYARETGKTGVCLVTSGPGATNTVTAIADAFYDSIPLVCFTGQVPLSLIGNDAFQEVDIVGMTRSVTKYGVTVRRREDLGRIIKMAFYIASTGKPGPVLIDIPKDVTAKVTEYEKEYPGVYNREVIYSEEEDLKKAVEMIKEAQRPYIFVGGGAVLSEASKELYEFAQKVDAPVTDSLMGKGAFPGTDERYTGMLGMHGTKASNFGVSECDLLIVTGARFSDRVTGNTATFAKDAKILQIDIDPAEMDKNVMIDLGVVGDIKAVLKKINEHLPQQSHPEWMNKIKDYKAKYPLTYHKDVLTGPFAVEEIYRQTNGEAIITTEVGQHQMWAAQYYKYTEPRTLLTSGGLGTMGYGLGAALGAKSGREDKVVVNIAGDGCFRMNMNEIATAVRHNIPVIQVVINNHVLGMVRQWQKLFYGKRYSMTCLRSGAACRGKCGEVECPTYTPDFMKLADSYGAKGIHITKKEDIEPAFREAMKSTKTPYILEFDIDPEDLVYPMVKPGGTLEDLIMDC